MAKRKVSSVEDDTQDIGPSSKQQRLRHSDYFCKLSDEALLLIFSYLSSGDLATCASVSKKWNTLSSDSLVWKRLFYSHFVEPRLPKRVWNRQFSEDKWFHRTREHEPDSEWKSLYRLRYNWHKGRCSVGTIYVSSMPSDKRDAKFDGNENLIVRFRGRSIFTVDSDFGLRAWDARGVLQSTVAIPRAHVDAHGHAAAYGPPSALYIHTQSIPSSAGQSDVTVIVGFTRGGFAIFTTRDDDYRNFGLLYTHSPVSHHDPITAIVYEYPFLVTLSRNQIMNIYWFQQSADRNEHKSVASATLVSSLKSQTIHGPVSLSMRKAAYNKRVFATIAYSHPFLSSSWTVAIQEIELDPDRGLVNLRAASSLPKESPIIGTNSGSFRSRRAHSSGLFELDWGFNETLSPPTSLSYSHPFLLASHADNTLISYLVKSTNLELTIGEGKRLWGHTSGIAHVEVKDRGKAVSISSNGSEIRVWDLESYPLGRYESVESVKLRIGEEDISEVEEDVEGIRLGEFFGFDDEKVVVEQEKRQGRTIMLYDFT
ncbi:hypothetical protein POJ06DRAFT_236827 [Lipomyces tetrasporus]|uniref:F-box domain-containing protein n=1 Tax=Lipomyces tetrasporus TaxID=54092 RepID=A0AAD7VU63_9ASCO|nr:uncharacterized protein POJ06DRAFT_236827 [Lipomyces tetrasporus]KAJ8102203.1 hypothetical protein POJ06DRAFT_236827 [Lipomyces tetrasporus]